ncbi:MAG: hypothetical protein Q4F72_04770 [Desulfovibrionaceae bacterium]|nr:hypothetical protein [Desulfovibrionaceae bacterium]
MASARTLRVFAGGLCVCLLLGACVFFLAVPVWLGGILAQVDRLSREATGQPLSFAQRPAISFFPLSFSFEDLHWGDADAPLTLTARSGRAHVRLSSLLTDFPAVSAVYLDAPVLTYREEAAPAALSTPRPQGAEGRMLGDIRGRVAAQAGAALPMSLQLDRLVILDGSVVADAGGGDRLTISNLNLSVRGSAEQTPQADVECDFTASLQSVSGELREATLALRSRIGLELPEVSVRGLEVTLTPLAGLYPAELDPAGLTLNGRMNLDTGDFVLQRCDIDLPQISASLPGMGRLGTNPRFEGKLTLLSEPGRPALLPVPARFPAMRLEGTARLEGRALGMPSFTLRAGRADVRGSLAMEFQPLHLRASMESDSLDFDELLAGSENRNMVLPAAEKKRAAGKEEGGIDFPDFELNFRGKSVLLRGVPLHSVEITASGSDRHFILSPLKAECGSEGRISALLSVSLAERQWESAGSFDGLPLKTVGALLGRQLGLEGMAAARWRLAGQTAAAHAEDSPGERDTARGVLAGQGALAMSGVRFAALRGALAALPEFSGAPLPEDFDHMFASFAVEDGRGSWRAGIADAFLEGDGTGSLDPFAGTLDGTMIVAFRGRHVPVRVGGSMAKPVFAAGTQTDRARQDRTPGASDRERK